MLIIKLNKNGQLNIKIKPHYLFKNIDNHNRLDLNNMPDRLIKHNNGREYIKKQKITYSIALYPYLTDEAPFTCIYDFKISGIKTLQSMYTHNKANAPKSFVNLIDFFTEDGIHKKYVDLYGEDIKWKIRVAENTFNYP